MLDIDGGKDPGASGYTIKEKDIVLVIAKKVEKLLEQYENVEVHQSRIEDVYLSLEERTKKANLLNADIFLSIHINASTNGAARGFETHIMLSPNRRTQSFQNVMHSEIMKAISDGQTISDRGKKQSNFHVLRESKMTALLSECLFISNSYDSKILKSEAFIDKLALGHANGLVKFLGLTKKTISEKPVATKELYQVITGTFQEKENAELHVMKLEKLGYKSYVVKKE
jgi:N-acetylmuramoyl-L-alanine amidase